MQEIWEQNTPMTGSESFLCKNEEPVRSVLQWMQSIPAKNSTTDISGMGDEKQNGIGTCCGASECSYHTVGLQDADFVGLEWV